MSNFTQLITGSKRHVMQLAAFFLLISFFAPAVVQAEGSRDLYLKAGSPNTGYRSGLNSRPSSTSPAQFDPFPNQGIMRVYAVAGETIYLGSSVMGLTVDGNTGKVELKRPNGTLAQLQQFSSGNWVNYISSNGNTAGRISNVIEEENGPAINGSTSDHYSPVRFIADVTGVYEVSFFSLGTGTNFNTNANNGPIYPNYKPQDAWVQPVLATSSAIILAWDVSVFSGTTYIPGRLYTNVINLVGPNNVFRDASFYGAFQVLTPSGYSYTVDLNGANGAAFNFFSNNKGVVDANGLPTYKSHIYHAADNNGGNNTAALTNLINSINNPLALDNATSFTNKIFYNTPASDLPASAPIFYSSGATTWLKTNRVTPEITNAGITCGGVISFTSNITGKVRVLIDIDGNNSYNDAIDVLVNNGNIAVHRGENIVVWNGRDGNSVVVSPSERDQLNVRIQLVEDKSEVHFPFFDMESNANGMKIILNEDPDKSIIYWNDDMTGTSAQMQESSPLNNSKEGSDGADGGAGGHAWGGATTAVTNEQTHFFGNNRLIDTWTFVSSQAELTINGTCLSVAGNVWHDDNAGHVNNSGKPIPVIYANLVDPNDGNKVLQSVPVSANGVFVFDGLDNRLGAYDIRLSQDAVAVGTALTTSDLPTGWEHTGQDLNPDNDRTTNSDTNASDGALSVSTQLDGPNVVGANFGIRPTITNIVISGTVFNDNNGDGIQSGAGEDAINGATNLLTAYLVSPTGKIVGSSAVDANGNYSLTGALPSVNYTVVVSNGLVIGEDAPAPALPGTFLNTKESFGGSNNDAGSGVEGTNTVPGEITVKPTGNVTGVNFGINEPPTAGSGANNAVDFGGDYFVPVPDNTFTNVTASSDENGGTVTRIRITGFPTNTTSIEIGGITYTQDGSGETTQWPTEGVLVNVDEQAQPTAGISVNPSLNGAGTIEIPFKAIDNAGLESANTGTAVLTFGNHISGTVFNDNNGTTDNANGDAVDGSTAPFNGLYVNLYDNNGDFVASVQLGTDGAYSFTNVPQANGYQVQLSAVEAGTGDDIADGKFNVPLPGSFVHVSSHDNVTPTNGVTIVDVSTTHVTGVNFGINEPPTPGNGANSAANPGGTTQVTVPGSTFTNGDGDTDNPSTDENNGTVVAIRITSFPDDVTSIVINGTTYTPTGDNGTTAWPNNGVTVATNAQGEPTVAITVDPSFDGPGEVEIEFVAIDNAGLESVNTGTAVLTLTNTLPITLSSFSAAKQGNTVVLNWSTASEQNNTGFYVERSNGGAWQALGFVNTKSENGTSSTALSYSYTDAAPAAGVNQYRLRQVDVDGKFTVSDVRQVSVGAVALSLYPNPVSSEITISGLSGTNKIVITNLSGQVVSSQTVSDVSVKTINVSKLAVGTYVVSITDNNGNKTNHKLVKQ